MVGFSGTIGETDQNLDSSADRLIWLGSENLFEFEDDDLKIVSVLHEIQEDDQPAQACDGETLIWIWGEIYGYHNGTEYNPKYNTHPDLSDAEYCARLYEENGLNFIEGLNSNFAGVIYDRQKNVVALFTDRLSAMPIFYTELEEDTLLFSTSLQSITNHPSFDPEFDKLGVQDFFTSGRVYGLRTVLKDVKQLHPAGILRYDLDSGEYNTEVYWRPKYEPKKRSFDDFVQEFYDIFKQVLSEQTQENLDYGLMLSGGSDSRLIAGAIDQKIKCFHMNETMNVEAETAKSVAKRCGHDFKFLKRDIEYYPKVLEKTSEISNLINWFEEGHTAGFVNDLTENSEYLFIGQYADTLFGHYIPEKNLHIPLFGNLQIPVLEKFEDVMDFEKKGKHSRNEKEPSYIDKEMLNSLDPISKNEKGKIKYQGMEYYSLESFIRGSFYYYPLTNTYSFLTRSTLIQSMPVRYPYLDNRIIDLSLQIPIKHLLRKDISNRTLRRYHKDLAKISHPTSGLPLTRSKLMHIFSKHYQDFLEKFSASSKPDAGPIADYGKIIRESDFVKRKLDEHSGLLEKCDFISKKKAWKVYQEHLEGKDKVNQLHPLLTFIENPITEKIILSDR